MIKPVLGYPSRTAAIEALLASGLTPQQIAGEIGGSVNSVQRLMWQIERRTSDRRVTLPRTMIDALRGEAARRDCEPAELATRLLRVIVRDELFDALLGEIEVGRA